MKRVGLGTLNPEGGSGRGVATESELGGLSDSARDGTLTLGGDRPRNDVVAPGDERNGNVEPTGSGRTPTPGREGGTTGGDVVPTADGTVSPPGGDRLHLGGGSPS